MSYKVKPISEPFLFGETPLWDHRANKLYFPDCFNCSMQGFDPLIPNKVEKRIVKGQAESPLQFLLWGMPCENAEGQLVVGTSEQQVVQYDWAKGEVTEVLFDMKAEKGVENAQLRCLEDGKCDAKGRLWFGSMVLKDMGSLSVDHDQGCIHKLSKSHESPKLATLTSGFDIPNGLAWNKENDKMFYVDLLKRIVNVYDFDLNEGIISNEKKLFEFGNEVNGSPDGMTVDCDGNLYIACWKGAAVIKIDSHTGKLIENIKMPVTNVTCACFGGDNFSDLFVTTTSIELDKTVQTGDEEHAGKLFQITNPKDNRFKGFPQHFFQL